MHSRPSAPLFAVAYRDIYGLEIGERGEIFSVLGGGGGEREKCISVKRINCSMFLEACDLTLHEHLDESGPTNV